MECRAESADMPRYGGAWRVGWGMAGPAGPWRLAWRGRRASGRARRCSSLCGSCRARACPSWLREWPACLADAQQMARFQASPYRLEREGGDCARPEPRFRKMSVDSDRHNTCSIEAAETPPKMLQPSSDDEAVAAPGSSSIPSPPPRGPDFRDLARFEWRVRQPTRRDTQCVPI